jgi:hypothetical protein
MMTAGTSLTITDEGLGPETGKGTDFITLTRAEAKAAAPKQVSAPKKKRNEPRRAYRNGIGLY